MKILMASCLCCGLLLMGCSEPVVIEPYVARVETYTLPKSNNQVIREFNAVARAQDLTPLSFRVDGRIGSIPVVKGQRVKKGDLLAALDKRDYEIALNDRTARMEVSRKQAERVKLLVDKQLVAQSEYDQINAQYLVSRAEARQAQLYLDYTELRAPFDGVVSDVLLESFENVQPGSAIVTMHKIERIDVEVQIPDILLAVSKRNDIKAQRQVYDVTFDAYPEVVFKGTILEMNTEKDPSSYTFIATLAVPLDEQYKVLEGMPAKVKANLSNLTYTYSRQHLVPIDAVLMRDGSEISEQEAGVWLYQADSHSVKYQRVKLGVIVGDTIEVVAGLADGQVIITSGGKRLVDGQRVELIKG
ncbi:efflux RND transporter periplasmic adaptor subunit [Shewanella canadensis]|uniref:Efflux RND transporter periplasmic adaptor subunit n=1 Tax=Shewanella canadensis TaxID=271096 RepID=A0A431WNS0_9GAMM|nr:efflux RND transporter periplasmic adaptor subunit [Shewanella canadensis]RTR37113.1 efflux RND transporter periplasmic adaptor subunit [Shewanella canadensis]